MSFGKPTDCPLLRNAGWHAAGAARSARIGLAADRGFEDAPRSTGLRAGGAADPVSAHREVRRAPALAGAARRVSRNAGAVADLSGAAARRVEGASGAA